MENILCQAYLENKAIVLTGDFNIDLSPHNQCCTTLRTNWESIYEHVELNQIINEPTRTTSTSSTLIDHMYVSDLQVTNCIVVKCGLSDHFPILGVFDVANFKSKTKSEHQTISYRKFDNVDLESFRQRLESAPWNDINFRENSTDDRLKKFNSLFVQIVDKTFPAITKRVKRKTQPKWITQEILRAITNRDNAKKCGDEKGYKYWRNVTTKLVRDSKAKHYQESVEIYKNNPRMLSNVFKELGGKSSHGPPTLINCDGKSHTQGSDIAEAFNKHFTNIANKYLSNDVNPPAQCEHKRLRVCQKQTAPRKHVPHSPYHRGLS